MTMLDQIITSSFEFQMTFLLFASLLGYIISCKLKQTVIVGQILAGIIIGPSVLGLIYYSDFISKMAEFGAIILLFTIGLGFSIKDVMNVKGIAIGILSSLASLLGGYLIAINFGLSIFGSIFIGTAIMATSVALCAKILKEHHMLKSDTGKVIIGAAITSDIVSFVGLSFAESYIMSSKLFLPVIFNTIKILLFLMIGLAIGYFGFYRINKIISKSLISKKFPEFVFIFFFTVGLGFSLISESIGISAVVGAFIAGVIIDEKMFKSHNKNMGNVLAIIFGSVFSISLGILIDVKEVTQELIIFSLVLSVVAVAGKVIGTAIASWRLKFSLIKSLFIGLSLSPRKEVAATVGLLALNNGLITQKTYISIIFMIIITAISIPTILNIMVKINKDFS